MVAMETKKAGEVEALTAMAEPEAVMVHMAAVEVAEVTTKRPEKVATGSV
jgi:hypothetical protein